MNAQVETKPGSEDALVVKLDLGCGSNKKEGFFGIDQYEMPGVDARVDLTQRVWLFHMPSLGATLPLEKVYSESVMDGWRLPDNSVDEIHCSHFLEHLDMNRHNPERVRFFNELYRVMKVGAKGQVTTPHWASDRAYGDFTHADKPVCEFFYFYLSKVWRKANAPATDIEWNRDGLNCDFNVTWGHGMRQNLWARTLDYQQYALENYKGAATDLIATIIKLPPT
jgi:hypothetical protein